MATARTLSVVEDGGLGALLNNLNGGVGFGEPLVRTPEVLMTVRDLLRARIPVEMLDPVAPATVRNPLVLEVLRREIGEQVERGTGTLRNLPTDEATLLALFRDTIGWGPAQAYLDDERVQEVKINGTQIMVQEDGADFTLVPERFGDGAQVLDRALLLASALNVPLDFSRTQGTLPLAHGTRMHVTIPPCTPDGTALVCIRRGRRYAWVLDDVYRRGGFNQEIYDLLLLLAKAKCSFIIAGETGSGKTALLESIVNSWPGQPHVITIEDNTLEINVKHETWTRELVQTATEPRAFGRAAKEALRQTPTIVAPGETRAEEAGAILTIAVSGHAVMTTLHAKSCQAAIQRFADCAAMPGAYTYEGRRDSALEDACDNIEVVIHVEKMSGRRYISEIVLLNGCEYGRGGVPRPKLVPLAEMIVNEAGQFNWEVKATAQEDNLVWKDDKDHTPAALTQKLRLLRSERRVRAAPTTRAAVEDALARANELATAHQIDLAVTTLRRAWADRRDPRLVAAAARTLELLPGRMDVEIEISQEQAERIEALLRRRAWGEAKVLLDAAQVDLVRMASLLPAGRWEAMDTTITAGMAADADCFERANQARQALNQTQHPQEVIALLGPDTSDRVSPEAALLSLAVRRDAITQLVQRGEASTDALEAVMARMAMMTSLRESRDA